MSMATMTVAMGAEQAPTEEEEAWRIAHAQCESDTNNAEIEANKAEYIRLTLLLREERRRQLVLDARRTDNCPMCRGMIHPGDERCDHCRSTKCTACSDAWLRPLAQHCDGCGASKRCPLCEKGKTLTQLVCSDCATQHHQSRDHT